MMSSRNVIAVVVVGTMLSAPAVSENAAAQINLPPGFELVEIGVNDKYTGVPAINECGQVVYTKDLHADSRLFLYDNGRITQLTDDDRGWLVSLPDINNAGTIVWHRKPAGYEGEVMMLKDGETAMVDVGRHSSINNRGEVVYQQFRERWCGASRNDIMLFDGRRSRRIYRSDWSDQAPDINDSGWVTWFHADFCAEPYWMSLVPLYDGNGVSFLTPEPFQYSEVTLNDSGTMAWGQPNAEPLRNEIYVWEAGDSWRLPVDISVGLPQLNNNGDVLYNRWNIESRSYDAWLFRGPRRNPKLYRLTDDRNEDAAGELNDHGEAVWRAMEAPPQGRWGGGVRFLRRIRSGDAEFDGDIDIADLGSLVDCITGPDRVSHGPEDCLCDCRFLDIDHDDDVDLADFARFQNAFTGKK